MANFKELNIVKQYVDGVLGTTIVPARKHLVNRAVIPAELKEKHHWVCWVVRNTKPSGKFDKIPINPINGSYIDGTNPKNWLSFEEACEHYDKGKCDGIGIGLSRQPFCENEVGEPLYLVALDFDGVANRPEEMQSVWESLKHPYTEVSPSGKGLRMFALSRILITGGNDGQGHEMYSSGRFVTVTGNVIGRCHD